MKVGGTTKCKLIKIEDNKIIRQDQLLNIVGNLINKKELILTDEYFIEEDNGWKNYFRRNYKKIFDDFTKLTNGKYKVEII